MIQGIQNVSFTGSNPMMEFVAEHSKQGLNKMIKASTILPSIPPAKIAQTPDGMTSRIASYLSARKPVQVPIVQTVKAQEIVQENSINFIG